MKKPHAYFANESSQPTLVDLVAFIPNEFKTGAGNWVQLSPFGDFDNAQGMQRVTPEDAQAMVNEFQRISLGNIATRVMGLPWYVGHPDHDAFKDRYTDTRAYGRVKELAVRHDPACNVCNEFRTQRKVPCGEHGLFGNVRWNNAGKELIEQETFHGHSVNWGVVKRGGAYHPCILKSVGFTNEPGIPVKPITTANEEQKMNKLLEFIKGLLGDSGKEIETEDAAMEAFGNFNKSRDDAMKKATDDCANACTERDTMRTERDAANTKLSGVNAIMAANETAMRDALTGANVTIPKDVDAAAVSTLFVNEFKSGREAVAKVADADKAKADAVQELANERAARVVDVKARAIAEGRLTKAEADSKELAEEFANEFTKTAARVLALPVKYRTQSSLAGERTAEVKDRQGKILELVNERMTANKNAGLDGSYDFAWTQIKSEKPELFAAMKQPESAQGKK